MFCLPDIRIIPIKLNTYVYAGNNSMLNNSQIHEKYLGCAFGLLRGNVLLLFMDKISTQNIYLYKKRQENIMKIMHLK